MPDPELSVALITKLTLYNNLATYQQQNNKTATMALRHIENRLTIRIDPRKEFRATIPEGFLEYEPDTERIEHLWENFRSCVNRQLKSRLGFLQNKYHRKVIFSIGMDKLCKDFSRRTESVKVSFELQKHGKEKVYLLTLTKLNAFPESCRNVRFCVAEIPPHEMQAYAEFVSFNDDNIGGRYDPDVHVSAIDDNTGEIPDAQATILEDSPSLVSSTRSITTVSSQQYLPDQQEFYYEDNSINPPVAMAVPEKHLGQR